MTNSHNKEEGQSNPINYKGVDNTTVSTDANDSQDQELAQMDLSDAAIAKKEDGKSEDIEHTFKLLRLWHSLSQGTQAIILMSVAQITTVTYQELVHVSTLQYDINVLDLCLVRSVGSMICGVLTMAVNQKKPLNDMPGERWGLMTLRNIVGLAGFNALIFAAQNLPIYLLQIFKNILPFVTMIFGYFINNEKISKTSIACMFGAFMGIVIVSMNRSDKDQEQNDKQLSHGKYKFAQASYMIGLIAVFFNILSHSSSAVIVRKINDVHHSLIMFHYGYFAFFVMAAMIAIEYCMLHNDNVKYPHSTLRLFTYDSNQWTLLLVMAFLSAVNLLLGIIAFQREKSGFIIMLTNMAVIYALIFDFAILGQTIVFGQIIGAILILGFNFTAVTLKYRDEKKEIKG